MDPDLELLQRWRDGDRSAGDDLFKRHFDHLRVYFVQRVSEVDPEDLIQTVFTRMVEARDRFEGRSTLRTYLFHIAQNVFRETLRAIHRPNGTFDPISESIADVSGRSQSSLVAANEQSQFLFEALRNLPSEVQDLIELRHVHELSMAELAEHFGIPLGTIKSRLQAAHKQLMRAIQVRQTGSTEASLLADLSEVRAVVGRGRARS